MVSAILAGLLPAFFVASRTASPHRRGYLLNVADALVLRESLRMLRAGQDAYDVDALRRWIAEQRLQGMAPPLTLPWVLPPNALPLLGLLTAGAPRTGLLLHVVASTALLLLAALWVGRTTSLGGPWQPALAVVALGWGGPVVFNALLGQTGALVGALVLLFAATFDERPRVSGLMLGLLAFKPHYAIPLGVIALLERRWSLLANSLVSLLTLTAVSGVAFGWTHWLGFIRAASSYNPTAPFMANWLALAMALGVGSGPDLQPGAPIVFLVGVAIVSLFAVASRRHGGGSLERLAFGVAVMAVTSPSTHPYDLTMLFLPVMVAARQARISHGWVAVLSLGMIISLLLAHGPRWGITLVSVLVAVAVAGASRLDRAAGPQRC